MPLGSLGYHSCSRTPLHPLFHCSLSRSSLRGGVPTAPSGSRRSATTVPMQVSALLRSFQTPQAGGAVASRWPSLFL